MPTIILYNGPIYTLDPAQPRVQAIAISGGRVIAAGSEGKVQAAVGGRRRLAREPATPGRTAAIDDASR